MKVEGASDSKPDSGSDYMRAEVVSYEDGRVQFQVGFDRYRLSPEMADASTAFAPMTVLSPSIRIKRGEGVIEGIFVNGVPLEQLSNAAAMDKARADKAGRSLFDRPHLVDSGMVPPKEE